MQAAADVQAIVDLDIAPHLQGAGKHDSLGVNGINDPDLASGTKLLQQPAGIADPPGRDGTTVLDFNKAYNPPCAYTPFTTCPMPLPENRLDLRIEAGEKKPLPFPG